MAQWLLDTTFEAKPRERGQGNGPPGYSSVLLQLDALPLALEFVAHANQNSFIELPINRGLGSRSQNEANLAEGKQWPL